MSAAQNAVKLRAARARPVRVLHLRDSPWVDGPGRTIIESGVQFDKQRIDYHIAPFVVDEEAKHPLVEAARARGLKVHPLKDSGGFDANLVRSIRRLVVELEIDIVHSSDIRSNIYALWSSRGHNIKLVTTTHGWIANDVRRWAFRTLDKFMLRKFDMVVMVSHAMRRLVPRWWVSTSKTIIIHNALVFESYGKEIVNESRPIKALTDTLTIVNIGRLSLEKGQNLLLAGFAPIARQYSNIRLRIVGVGPMENNLRAQAKELGISDQVDFAGFISEMPSVYRDADLVVQSSLTEGLPNVILEAAYLRVPIVATRVGGTDEVVKHGQSAWLIPAGSSTALQHGIAAFLADMAGFREMANTAHREVINGFSMKVRTAKITEVYETIVGEAL